MTQYLIETVVPIPEEDRVQARADAVHRLRSGEGAVGCNDCHTHLELHDNVVWCPSCKRGFELREDDDEVG